jgi:beta-1,4-mannosyl-glycoprotein beta-1,4-N-acetylglucosaminyltransferase
MPAFEISTKIKTFAHTEFNADRFSSIKVIKKKIDDKQDLFERGHFYKKVKINKSFPEYILKNKNDFKKFIVK